MGIPEADFPFIFDRYYQVASPQTASLGGNGIGLALTKELTQILGGDIQVESKLNKGTTFTLRLPITNAAALLSQLPQKQVKQPPPDLPDTLLSPTTLSASQEVLIIEDNPDVAEYLRDCLRPYYQLDFATNGKDGIAKALNMIPDLIISDVMMPGKDDFEVCENLKNDLRTSHVPIMLLTAKAGIENRIAGLQHRADAYLVKPFHEAELLVTLDNLLENRRKLQERFSGKKEVDSLSRPELSPEEQFLQQLRRIIHEHLADTGFSVEDLSRRLALSPRQLHRKLAALTGQSPSDFIRGIRLEKAKEFLQTQKMNVSEAAYATGFEDPKYFSRVFKKAYGLPPSKV
jgi:YesN/AraC family two-component response regulator